MILRKLIVLFLVGVVAACAGINTKPLLGDWNGKLVTPMGDLRLVFHFTEIEQGYDCKIDSLDQGANGIPCGEVSIEDNLVTVKVPVIGGEFVGILTDDILQGEWTQAGFSLDLDLTRATQ